MVASTGSGDSGGLRTVWGSSKKRLSNGSNDGVWGSKGSLRSRTGFPQFAGGDGGVEYVSENT